jgi:peptide/nickel transport system permease protein
MALPNGVEIDMQPIDTSIETAETPTEIPSESQVVSQRAALSKSKLALFFTWVKEFYSGEFQDSRTTNGGTIRELLINKLPRTLLLLVPGTLIGFWLGIFIGVRVAWRRRNWLAVGTTLGGTAFYTSFPPWLAFVMISVFAFSLDWFPPEKLITPDKWAFQDATLNEMILALLLTLGMVLLTNGLITWLARLLPSYRRWVRIIGWVVTLLLVVGCWGVSGRGELAIDILYHLALPLITLVLLSFGETMLIMKTTMSETVTRNYVQMAQAKGVPAGRVRDHHAARVAILPVMTRFVMHLPLVIIGSFVLETLFFWDGMAKELMDAANNNNLAVLMGVLSLVAILILLAHIVFDIMTAWLDPRLRMAAP